MKKKYLFLIIAGAMLFVSAFILNDMIAQQRLAIKADLLNKQAEQLTSVAKIDRERMTNINKALSVLNRFNPSMALPTKYALAAEISDASMKYNNLDAELICATITHESAFSWNPEVVSPAGALGLMQVMPATGRFLAHLENIKWTSPEAVLFDPILNVRLGCKYLSSLIEMYEIDGGLAAYNGGGKRAAMWLAKNRADGILYAETQNYVPAVLSLYEEFRTVN